MYAKLQELLAAPAPGFICRGAGSRAKLKRFVAKIKHRVGGPSSADDLARLAQMVSEGAGQLSAFYRDHDGVELYVDTVGDAVGIELYAIKKIESGTNEFREWLGTLELEEGSDTNKLKSAIAVGEVPHSGNYFAMPVDGQGVGKVFYVDHDDWHEEPFAGSFDEFVERVSSNPVKLLSEDLGCYARYSDGQTDIQWIPEEYLPDFSKARLDNEPVN